MPIQAIWCNPSLCIARVGESSVPMDAFSWAASEDPHIIGETRIKPAWTLDVQSDGSVTPRMPTTFALKDNGRIRPVAPFVEIWCDVGDDGDEANWTRQPLTTSLLAANSLNIANITFDIQAMNLKVARRTGNVNHRYGTRQPVHLRGDEHAPQALLGQSPVLSDASPMIPEGRAISLGSVQVIRPGIQPDPADTVVWAESVSIETMRLRITPATGAFFGPPGSALPVQPSGRFRGFPAVPPGNDFLDAAAGWLGARTERVSISVGQQPQGLVAPGDTYDGAEMSNGNDQSLGIIDDTCEILIEARLDQTTAGRSAVTARANIFCGPPDYAPDRRPFLSLADGINDRAGDKPARNQAISDEDLDRWVEDLFERAFETVSLFNVDFWRRQRASDLPPAERRASIIPDDATRDPERAMGGLDALRDGNSPLPAPSSNIPLPVSERARERHRDLSDIVALKRYVRQNPDRLEALIRRPFFSDNEENAGQTTMQMPPFMRNSNALPLTLAEWQYDLLMEWQRRVLAGPPTIEEERGIAQTMSPAAEERRRRVLEQLEALDEPI